MLLWVWPPGVAAVTTTMVNAAVQLFNTVSVANGGTGLSTLTSNAIYKGNGTSPMSASSLSDNGTTVSTGETVSVGSSPPSCTFGTGGALCLGEGTAPSGLSSVDQSYANSTNHCFDIINNATEEGCAIVAGSTNGGLPTVTGSLASNATMSSTATMYTGPSISLTAGTWMVTGTVTLGKASATGAALDQCELYDGTTNFASAETTIPYVSSAAIQYNTMTLSGIMTESGSVTAEIECETNVASGIIYATTVTGSLAHASTIAALRIK